MPCTWHADAVALLGLAGTPPWSPPLREDRGDSGVGGRGAPEGGVRDPGLRRRPERGGPRHGVVPLTLAGLAGSLWSPVPRHREGRGESSRRACSCAGAAACWQRRSSGIGRLLGQHCAGTQGFAANCAIRGMAHRRQGLRRPLRDHSSVAQRYGPRPGDRADQRHAAPRVSGRISAHLRGVRLQRHRHDRLQDPLGGRVGPLEPRDPQGLHGRRPGGGERSGWLLAGIQRVRSGGCGGVPAGPGLCLGEGQPLCARGLAWPPPPGAAPLGSRLRRRRRLKGRGLLGGGAGEGRRVALSLRAVRRDPRPRRRTAPCCAGPHRGRAAAPLGPPGRCAPRPAAPAARGAPRPHATAGPRGSARLRLSWSGPADRRGRHRGLGVAGGRARLPRPGGDRSRSGRPGGAE
mmetsp:Transcript_123547/g.357245  ORF Transcript_123547/g.357245 Transcript_123547/m.357245 type:complete len:405 (+) Transcript_123547:532-1746(+)